MPKIPGQMNFVEENLLFAFIIQIRYCRISFAQEI
jgi:hypothetical protein